MLTKNDMARVVVQALYLTHTLPSSNHGEVKRIAKMKKAEVQVHHKLALKILNQKIKEGYFYDPSSQ